MLRTLLNEIVHQRIYGHFPAIYTRVQRANRLHNEGRMGHGRTRLSKYPRSHRGPCVAARVTSFGRSGARWGAAESPANIIASRPQRRPAISWRASAAPQSIVRAASARQPVHVPPSEHPRVSTLAAAPREPAGTQAQELRQRGEIGTLPISAGHARVFELAGAQRTGPTTRTRRLLGRQLG